jgi:hypothetical protein
VQSKRRILVAGAALWCAAVGFGIRELARYETTAGAAATAPARWPDTRLPRGEGATVVMFLHPDCPCSRASLGELAKLDARGATIDIVFEGAHGSLWERAGDLPGATRITDDGSEAARFGAKTSGYVVVYDRTGTQRFAGGITASRGHAGDNIGRLAVQRILDGAKGPAQHAVFGCAL